MIMRQHVTGMMKFSWWILMVFAFAKANYTQAQSSKIKIEKEERIQQEALPLPIIEAVTQVSEDRKVKYYKEIDGEKISFEGKFKKAGNRYSMEFDVVGNFEDLEVEVKKRSVDKLLWNAISLKLDSISSRWRTEKIQEQYLPESTMEKFKEKLKSSNFENLEIIAAFKKDGKILRKELLFSAAGALIQMREVKRIAYDFLLF
ncbi:hypothetical protein SAMN05192588_2533 [Nonlabens sp. Hel1_33_55]|nr:hypothetical protein SAMN05192588_2533 [Nonlabens sp. Hel1_33_55]